MTLCIPLCICRLTLTCILCEISTKPRGMLIHLDWSSLTDTGLSLMPTGLFCCSVSTANSPSALTFWLGQKCHSKVMHRKEVTYYNGSYERKSRGRKLADEMGRAKKNSHGTVIDWCTGREWPLNCMTVISVWWRLNIRFQRSSGRWTII